MENRGGDKTWGYLERQVARMVDTLERCGDRFENSHRQSLSDRCRREAVDPNPDRERFNAVGHGCANAMKWL